jgi:hypothetical protein
VDYLVKQEFDKYRERGTLPPVLKKMKLSAKLFPGDELSTWRNNFKGISFIDENLNAILYGAIDDVLEFPDGSLAVVDYKSSGSKEIRIYDDYQKQMDIYTHILEGMNYKTQKDAYFVFYKVNKSTGGFDNALHFDEEVRTVKVDSTWVQDAFERAVKLARQGNAPTAAGDCKHCTFVSSAGKHSGIETYDTQADRQYVLIEEE